jgi:hypothetical protein
MIRIIVAIDVDTDDPTEAYRVVDAVLDKDLGIEWESTDEWYGDDGEPMDEDEISAIRMKFHDGI